MNNREGMIVSECKCKLYAADPSNMADVASFREALGDAKACSALEPETKIWAYILHTGARLEWVRAVGFFITYNIWKYCKTRFKILMLEYTWAVPLQTRRLPHTLNHPPMQGRNLILELF